MVAQLEALRVQGRATCSCLSHLSGGSTIIKEFATYLQRHAQRSEDVSSYGLAGPRPG
jgi:hypothetical protein